MSELEKARKAAQVAAEKLAKLEAEEAARQAEIAAQRREREEAWSAQFLETWFQRAAEATEYEKVNDYDPNTMGFLEGLIRFAAARMKREHVLNEARRSESILGVSIYQSVIPESRYYEIGIVQHLEQIVRKEAERRAAEFADQLDAEREQFISGVKPNGE